MNFKDNLLPVAYGTRKYQTSKFALKMGKICPFVLELKNLLDTVNLIFPVETVIFFTSHFYELLSNLNICRLNFEKILKRSRY